MKTVICSHGFGVKADSRGMFTDISQAFPDYNFILFDYNTILDNGDIEVADIDSQVAKLQSVVDKAEGEISLLCHSQGCIVGGLIDASKINKAVLLAPPIKMSMQRVIEKLQERPGSEINLDGVSKLPRTDGTTTLVPSSYVKSLDNRDPIKIYKELAERVPTAIVKVEGDNVLGNTDFSEISNAKVLTINADHDFTGNARAELIATLKNIL
ncbi:MAG: alpha/beta hydrolase [Candidatus Saccharimonadales bacterium]